MGTSPALLLMLLLTAPASASAESKPEDLSAHPEMSRERILPLIAKGLRDHLLDAGSVTNFSVCYPPVKVKLKNGRPVRWTVMFSLNAKNSYGGYTGLQMMAAIFYADKPLSIASTGMPPLGQYKSCSRVPDAEIRQLIEAD